MNLEINKKFPLLEKLSIYYKVSDVTKGILISAIIFTVFLFFFDSSIKYLFYIFGLSLATILILFVYQNDFKFKLTVPSPKLIDYFLIICSVLAFTLDGNLEEGKGILLPLSIIVSLFLPGWVLLRVLGVKDFQRPDLPDLSLSFVLSIGLSAFIFLIVSQTGLETGKIIFGIYIIISILPVLIDRVQKEAKKQKPKIDNKREFGFFQILILLWIIAFFVTVISLIYPETSLIPGLDIVGHLSKSSQILTNPELFGSVYPTYHLMLATLTVLSSSTMWFFQTGLAYLSIILVFSFYIMAKGYLKEISPRAPILATIFFFVFSGFGWIYFTLQRLNPIVQDSYFRILLDTNNISYLDTFVGQGSWLWLWFRPITLGFTIFFVLLYLLKNDGLSKRNYIIITSLLVGSLAGIHFPELVIFVLLIFVVIVFKPNLKLRLKETVISILIGLSIWLFLLYLYQQFFDPLYQIFSFQFLSILAILTGISLVLITFNKRPSFTFKINPIVVVSAALFVYVILFLAWFVGIDEDKGFTFKPDYGIPIEYYPVLLGVVGGIAIGGAIIVAKKHWNRPIILFLILFILAIVVGKIITYLNLNFFDTGYFERRLLLFVYVASTLLASITFLYILKSIDKINHGIIKSLVYGFVISIIVMVGVFSTFLAVEYNYLRLPDASMSEDEFFLQSQLGQVDSNSILLTVSDRSKNIAKFVNLGDIVNKYRYPLWTSKNPEQTLNIISILNSSTIIYLNPADSEKISENYQYGYINSHLLQKAPIFYDGHEGKIIQIPSVSSPSIKSSVALVLPDEYAEFYHAYDILSLGGYDYTTILLSDLNSLNEARVVITPNEEITLKMIEYRKESNLKFEKLIVLNTDVYTSFLFERQDDVSLDNLLFSDNIKYIATNQEIKLPYEVQVHEVIANSDFEVKAQYHPKTPFHLHKEYDGFDLDYFDFNPIIESLNSDDEQSREIFPYLGKILRNSDIDLPLNEIETISRFIQFSKGVYVFKSAIFQGDLMLEANSTIINLKNNPLIVNLVDSKLEIENVTKIVPINIDYVSVNANQGVLKDGKSFYSKVLLNQSSVRFVGTPAIISIVDINGNQHTISSEEIEIKLPSATFLIRQPKVICEGLTTFENFYGFGKIPRSIRFDNENFQINGTVTLDNVLSDEFTISRDNSFKGKIISVPHN